MQALRNGVEDLIDTFASTIEEAERYARAHEEAWLYPPLNGSRRFAPHLPPDPTLSVLLGLGELDYSNCPNLDDFVRQLLHSGVWKLPPSNALWIGTPYAGTPIDVSGLAKGFVASALQLVYIRREELSRSWLSTQLLQAIGDWQSIARTKSATCTEIIAWSGAILTGKNGWPTPWGQIRGAAGCGSPEGWGGAAARPATLLLLRDRSIPVYPYRSLYGFRYASSEEYWGDEQAQLLLPLSVGLLEVGRQRPVIREVWRTTHLSVLPIRSAHISPIGGSSFNQPLLNAAQDRFQRIVRYVASGHSGSMDVAVRRFSQALVPERRPEDRLVDAVIVWESVVGGPGPDKAGLKAAVQSILAEGEVNGRGWTAHEIYRFRNATVHGDRLEPEKVHSAMATAIDLAARLLSLCYEGGRRLCEMPPEDRAKELVRTVQT